MELSKSQDRRLNYVANLLSLNPLDPVERKKALRHLNLEDGCFHGYQYSGSSLELFIFLDEQNPVEEALASLAKDLKTLQVAITRTSDPSNPFFLSIREEADPWLTLDPDVEEEEDESGEPQGRPRMDTLEVTVLRTRFSRDLTDYELERTIKELRRRLSIWKKECKANLEIIAEQDDLAKDALRALEDKLELPLDSQPLHMTSRHGELFLGFVPIQTIYNYHMELGRRHKAKHNQIIVSSNIRTYLGSATHTNAALIDAFREMEKAGSSEDFPFLHNGMTLTGDDLRTRERDGQWILQIDRPKIINGAQSLFTYEQYAKKAKTPINPKVLVKVVVPYAGAGQFVRQVTMANNRQNPVFSWHLRAADETQFFIWQKLQEEGFTYVFKEGVRIKARTRKLELKMRPEMARTLLLLDAQVTESKSPDCVFDQESLYQRCFGSFLKVDPAIEHDFTKKVVAYTKAWQLLTRTPIKIRTITPGKGSSIEPNEENPLTRITWNGKLDEKLAFRTAVRDLAVALALRHWLKHGDPIGDFERLKENELDFNASVLRYATKVCGDALKTALVQEYKDNASFYETVTTTDRETGETAEKKVWKGLSTTETYEAMLTLLGKKDSAWQECKGGLEVI